jgi:acyl dehydratase
VSSGTGLFSEYFDALSDGDSFRTRGRTLTEADVVSFAALTGDWHPQHSDAVWAAESAFGERIAHGMLVLSYAVGLVPLDPERIVALRRVEDAVFKAPARLGDTIHVEGKVARRTPVDDSLGLVGCQWRVVRQDGMLVARVGIEVLWRRRPAEEAEAGHEAEAVAPL